MVFTNELSPKRFPKQSIFRGPIQSHRLIMGHLFNQLPDLDSKRFYSQQEIIHWEIH